MRYQKTWFSTLIISLLGFFDLFLLFFIANYEANFITILLFSFSVVGTFLFPALKVEVDSTHIHISFIFGLYTNSYLLSDFETIQAVENDQLISWLFNPKGKHSASFKTRFNSTFYLPVENDLKLITYCRN